MEKVGARPIMQELRVGVHSTGAVPRVLVGLKQTKTFYVKFIATEQCSEEVSRGQKKEITPIHGKTGSSVAIKNPGPDATAGSGNCPSADCQSSGTAASVCPHLL